MGSSDQERTVFPSAFKHYVRSVDAFFVQVGECTVKTETGLSINLIYQYFIYTYEFMRRHESEMEYRDSFVRVWFSVKLR